MRTWVWSRNQRKFITQTQDQPYVNKGYGEHRVAELPIGRGRHLNGERPTGTGSPNKPRGGGEPGGLGWKDIFCYPTEQRIAGVERTIGKMCRGSASARIRARYGIGLGMNLTGLEKAGNAVFSVITGHSYTEQKRSRRSKGDLFPKIIPQPGHRP